MATEAVQMKVSGLMCSFCTMSVEKALKRYPGVNSVLVNLVHGIVLVDADTKQTSREDLKVAVEKLGYEVSATEVQQYAADENLFKLIKRRGAIGMSLSILDLIIDPINLFKLPEQMRTYFSFAVAMFVLFWVGQPILRKTLLALSQRVINANVLLSAGAWGSFVIGSLSLFDPRWPNFLPVAAWLMSLHLFFGYFKLDTRKKASEAVRKLLSLQPSKARVFRGGQHVEVLTKEVTLDEIVQVRPGERIPLDGEVIEGSASVDESSFTGESLPASKLAGSKVIGGTMNLDGALQIRVTKIGEDTFLHQIVKLMTRIAENKPSIELLADRLMNFYGPIVFIVAGIAFGAWALVSGDYVQATVVLITTIIMGYPCALGITTPMLAAIAGGKGISVGLLVKASEVFHGLSIVNTVVFDKTGTLTYGRPTVTDVIPIGVSREQLLSFAGSVEGQSEHPLGKAIGFLAKKEGAKILSLEGFRAVIGNGVSGKIEGNLVLAGKPKFIEESGIELSGDIRSSISKFGSEGKTTIVVAHAGKTIGLISLQDTPRKGAERVIEKLHLRGIKTVMLTGDAKGVADAIAKNLGINEVRSELLPQDKVAAIESLQSQGRKVAMVGDGINDAPALAQSDVGIAIGAGTDVAIESAGVILIGDKLDDVLGALILGKASYKTLTGNVVVAVIFNIAGMILAALGYVTPLIAISVMVLSIFAILLNTLRIRTLKIRSDEPAEIIGALAEIEFAIPKMHCAGCAEKITTALSSIQGIREIKTKVPQKRLYVQYEPSKLQETDLKNLLDKAGFTAIAI